MESIVEEMGFHGLISVDANGKSGGLAVLWKDVCSVEMLQANRRVIDLKVQWQGQSFYLTFVYGDLVKSKRKEVWERIGRIGAGRKGAWLLTGDFNEILDQSEKEGEQDVRREKVKISSNFCLIGVYGKLDMKGTICLGRVEEVMILYNVV